MSNLFKLNNSDQIKINKNNSNTNKIYNRFQFNFEQILASNKKKKDLDYFATLNELEHLVLCDLLDMEEQDAFLFAKENESLIKESQHLNIYVDQLIENRFAELIVQKKLDKEFLKCANPLFHACLERFDSLTQSEIHLGEIGDKDKVLFIGGGGFPISAINYERYAQCQIFCVEKIRAAKEKADSVISSLNLEHRIQTIFGEGQEIDCSSYDVIVVAVLARPKDQILKNILKTAKPNVKILCRTTFGVRSALCPSIKKEENTFLLSFLDRLGAVTASGNQVLSSIYFKKI